MRALDIPATLGPRAGQDVDGLPIERPDGLPAEGLAGVDIVCLASAPWEAASRVNCHHVMSRLAGRNRVLFVDSLGMRSLGRRDIARLWRRFRDFLRGVRRASPGLYVVSPVAVPFHRAAWSVRINGLLLRWQVKRAMRSVGMQQPVAWVFNPMMVRAVPALEPRAVVYHCVDDYGANARTAAAFVRRAELEVLSLADIVFVTSRTLFESRKGLHCRVVLVENVADVAHFSKALATDMFIPEEMAGLPHPIVGYVGNIASRKVNLDVLVGIARARPNWSLVLIGPEGVGDPWTDLTALRSLSNVHLLGPRPYEELTRYVKGLDVCLIPFQQNPLTAGSFPMKFFEYLAAGKPVVATPLPSLDAYRACFRQAQSADEYVAQIEAALREDLASDRVAERVALAANHDWGARMRQIESHVAQVVPEVNPRRPTVA
jgi:glycosyltransferase involved in cell wall biosynthesis